MSGQSANIDEMILHHLQINNDLQKKTISLYEKLVQANKSMYSPQEVAEELGMKYSYKKIRGLEIAGYLKVVSRREKYYSGDSVRKLKKIISEGKVEV